MGGEKQTQAGEAGTMSWVCRVGVRCNERVWAESTMTAGGNAVDEVRKMI